MKTITKNAYAKINISLDIVGKREDGYHKLKSIMQTVSLADLVTVTQSTDGISLSTNYAFLPTNQKNIAVKAAMLFSEKTGLGENISIEIKKSIPVGGGLGGGSADAAAVLRILNEMYEYPLTENELLNLGLLCGADVPFCMCGGTKLCEGIGEKMTALSPMPNCYILIIKPSFSISTKSVYSLMNIEKLVNHPDTDGMIRALEEGSLKNLCVRLYNVLETPAASLHPEIDNYKKMLKRKGAIGSLMSGSGSTVFGIFDNFEIAKKAQNYFKSLNFISFLVHPVQEYKLK